MFPKADYDVFMSKYKPKYDQIEEKWAFDHATNVKEYDLLTQSFLFFYSSSKESSLRCLYWSNAINPAIGARMAIACSVVETTSLTISKEAIALYVSIPR